MKSIRLSVRRLVELVLRCGDIDNRYVDSAVMWKGAKAHRKIQAEMGGSYRPEVSLKTLATIADTDVTVFGRADGVITGEDGSITIDEIKTTTLPLDRLDTQRKLFLGQAQCYAYMLLAGMENPPETVTLQLTYFQLETQEIQRKQFAFTKTEIDRIFFELLEAYHVWMRFESGWQETRDASIKAAQFPFPSYRKGQRELAVAVYRSIERRKKLYVQAPTGIGKTISALFPSVKAAGEGITGKVFYLTAKTVTRAVAEDAVRMMAKGGLRYKSVTLRAKDKSCFCDERICNPDHCSYAKGHYDRVNGAVLDILEQEDLITPDLMAEYAKKHHVCPYETSLDVAEWVDLVICDYNYLFDPVVYLRRFFSEEGGDYTVLIDEAHNLLDRVRDMYSAELQKSDFTRLKREIKEKSHHAKRLKKAATAIDKRMLELRKECGENAHRVDALPDESLGNMVKDFTAACDEWLAVEQHSSHPLYKQVLELYFSADFYTAIASECDERYAVINESAGSELIITLFCLDPSAIIREKLSRANGAALFSATLTPLGYYREMLGGDAEDRLLSLASPFDQERQLLLAHCGISTRYIHREESIHPIVDAIYRATQKKRGNYMVYFPSYQYLKAVEEAFLAEYPDANVIIQQSNMDEDSRAAFIARFDESGGNLIGFCVLGGIFSEGIDLAGERLIGVVIVGVGLPKISLRGDLIKEYFNRKNADGYDYAYVFPGMNKVLQAAGRVIRTEKDYGVVLLIDSRFNTAKYRSLYPAHWSGITMVWGTEELDSAIEGFSYFW